MPGIQEMLTLLMSSFLYNEILSSQATNEENRSPRTAKMTLTECRLNIQAPGPTTPIMLHLDPLPGAEVRVQKSLVGEQSGLPGLTSRPKGAEMGRGVGPCFQRGEPRQGREGLRQACQGLGRGKLSCHYLARLSGSPGRRGPQNKKEQGGKCEVKCEVNKNT